MKKTTYIIIGLLFSVITSVYSQFRDSDKKSTMQEVRQIADKYNLQDFEISETKNNLLLFMSKEQINNYFKKVVQYRELVNAYASFKEKNQQVRTYSDYFALLDQIPIVKKDVVYVSGGEEKYAKFQQDVLKSNWRIYRSLNGDLYFFKADTKIVPNETKVGKRIDNLPRE